MSTLSNVHTFVSFDSKTSAPAHNQRLVKVLYKTQRGGKAVADARKSVCVSVPRIQDIELSESQTQALIPHIYQLLENAQDGICKDSYERNAISVSDSELSIDACIAFLDAESSGSRLTKEYIVEWFNGSLRDVLYVMAGDKIVTDPGKPTDVEEKRIEQVVTVYREKFASMAGGRTMFNIESCNKLLKVLENCGDDDSMAKRFSTKLQKMVSEQNDTLEAL